MDIFPYLRQISLKTETIESFDKYPFSIPAVKFLEEMKFESAVTFLVGENENGKSTILEAIAVALGFEPEGGTKNFNFSIHESHSPLHDHVCLVESHIKPKDGFFHRAQSYLMWQLRSKRWTMNPQMGCPFNLLRIRTVEYRCTNSHTENHFLR